jgi:hypothetical protein
MTGHIKMELREAVCDEINGVELVQFGFRNFRNVWDRNLERRRRIPEDFTPKI